MIKCPCCRSCVSLEDYVEVFDDTISMRLKKGWSFLEFECPECEETFTAKVDFKINITKIDVQTM